MKEPVFYTAGRTGSMLVAERILRNSDFRFAPTPDRSVTHLLLGVPAFEADGSLKGGSALESVLPLLSPEVTVLGGMLHVPVLQGYRTVDLLEDPGYVAENARITAYCAVRLAMQHLPHILWQCPVLVIGWGRIGKCLAQLLRSMGAQVSVAARKEADREILRALGFDALDTHGLGNSIARFAVIFNTAPVPVLTKEDMADCRKDCLKIELSSFRGMDSEDVIWARGLPGKDAPESSGALIARTILRKGVIA